VNNAGVFQFEPLEAVTEAEFHREFNTNVLGPILATQEAVKRFGPEGGSVINVSSVTSANPAPMSVVYSATKSALDSVTRVLARELGPRNIRVNSILPGVTETEGALRLEGFGDLAKELVPRTSLGRVGRPEDIAPTVVFLASGDSGWLTGETIRVSGGLQ
jgi:3-oxoacyl-[acyl-carrier protein] reductase